MALSPGRWGALALAVAMTVSGAGPARAGDNEGDTGARARAHFEVGRGLYNLGNYSEAIKEFAAGYALAPRPGFLLNLIQAHRKLNHLTEASTLCRKFLAEAPADDPGREQASALLAEIERELVRHPPPPEPPPTLTTPAPPPSSATPTPAPPTVIAIAPATLATRPAPPRRRWLWPVIGVSAAVVAATLAGVLTVVLSTDYSARARASCSGNGCVLLDGFH